MKQNRRPGIVNVNTHDDADTVLAVIRILSYISYMTQRRLQSLPFSRSSLSRSLILIFVNKVGTTELDQLIRIMCPSLCIRSLSNYAVHNFSKLQMIRLHFGLTIFLV